MHEKSAGEIICSRCGFDERTYICPSSALPPHTVLNGKYILGKVLGAGGFGITYIAFDTALEKIMAVKEMFVYQSMYRDNAGSCQMPAAADSGMQKSLYEINRDKFAEEARILARLEKVPGIVRVYDLFEENGTLYTAMEYLPGMTLKDYCRKHGRMSFRETLRLMTPMMDSLASLHREGILHRDISPGNIMVSPDKTLTLFDFGGAKICGSEEKSQVILAKEGYSPVEQLQTDGSVGPWTDIYSLSAVIYFCVTGVVPAASAERVAGKDPVKRPRSLGAYMTGSQEKALMKGLAVRSRDRYQSMEEMEKALGAGKRKGLSDKAGSAAVKRHRLLLLLIIAEEGILAALQMRLV